MDKYEGNARSIATLCSVLTASGDTPAPKSIIARMAK